MVNTLAYYIIYCHNNADFVCVYEYEMMLGQSLLCFSKKLFMFREICYFLPETQYFIIIPTTIPNSA